MSRGSGRAAATRRIAKYLVGVLTLAVGVLGCGDASSEPPRLERPVERVVLVTLDTLHIDFTSVHNPEVDYTPTLGRLAEEGLTFLQARTSVPMTLPAHSSLFSGQTPTSLGVLRNGVEVPIEMPTLARAFQSAGYRTGAFVSLATLNRQYGLDRGFETYDDGSESTKRTYRTADEVVRAALPWLEQHRDEPYLAWIHLSDPHEPYVLKDAPADVVIELDGREIARSHLTSREIQEVLLELPPGRHVLRWKPLRRPREDDLRQTALTLRFQDPASLSHLIPDPAPDIRGEIHLGNAFDLPLVNTGDSSIETAIRFQGRLRRPAPSEVLPAYRAEVEWMDRWLGELVNALEADGPPVLWIVISDHGEGLYRRGRILGHAGFGMEDQLRILWLMKGPGVPTGVLIEDVPVLIHDVAPTVLQLAGLPELPGAEGLSLVDCWRKQRCPDSRQWIAHGVSPDQNSLTAVAAYDWPWKRLLQARPGSGTYDLANDPWESTDLGDRQDHAAELRRLDQTIEEISSRLEQQLGVSDRELSPEEHEALRSLGYLD